MNTFKPKRVSGADLAAQLAGATASLPPVVVQHPSRPASQPLAQRNRPPAVVQINFKASEAFADLIAQEAEKAGSTRRLFARLMREAGYEVPEADVNPPDNRRRRGGNAASQEDS
ncbi:hypothetical protein E0493_22315 [Roseomonas sp. M0104]|uniref:Uncharacterized protein n=1 Tax=Teichococcus coralli TaxID=2545983 RepID=A0A845BEU5_9PROT|nr:hypothetical protein [Pseudoroseomonas coralli]MXP66083.1 hypothetical protein [Pseudoroseomonas coralli]